MRIPFVISIFLHVAVVLVAWLGLPHLSNDDFELQARSIEVEMVSEEDIVKKVAQVDTPPPPPPPPSPPPKPPEPEPEPTPEPAPEPEPEPEAEPVPVEPKKPEPKPEVKKPEPKPEPPQPQLAQQPRPTTKPKAPPKMDMASVLKTVAELEDEPVQKKAEAPEEDLPKEKVSLADAVAAALKTEQKEKQVSTFDGQLSMSEMDAVKRQIAGCWSIQSGARDAENLLVKLKVLMNPDMTVRSVQVVDTGESSNPFWQAAADGAKRAVLKCKRLNLPPGKYDVWKVINFTFDPKQMFG